MLLVRFTPFLVLATTGCGGPPRSAVSATAPPRACTVHGQSVRLLDLRVWPAGLVNAECFTPSPAFSVRDVPVDAFLPPCAGTPPDYRRVMISSTAEPPPTPAAATEILLTSPLAARARRGNVWFRLTRDITSRDGTVTARRNAQVVDACVRGDQVFASAILFSDSVDPGDNRPAPESVSAVEVPCDALTLDAGDAATSIGGDDVEPYPSTGPMPHDWQLAGEVSAVALYVTPRAGAAAHEIAKPGTQASIYVRELEQRGAWLRVETRGEGVVARGWVPASELVRVPEGTMVGRSYGDEGHVPTTVGSLGDSTPPVMRKAVGPRGTPVYTSTGSTWATFVADTPVVVRDVAGASLVELTSVPGLVISQEAAGLPAWVSRNTLRFDPPEATP